MRLAITAVLALSAPCFAQQIATEAQLAALLGDSQLIEDFEGVSLSGGTGVSAPNPLNAATAPPTWGLLSDPTYSSLGLLSLHTGFLHGDDSNLLEGTDGITVEFDAPQVAVGFDVVNPTGNVTRTVTVEVFYEAVRLGSATINLSAASDAFFGWQAATLGITRVEITSVASITSGFIAADNFEWGLVASPCPADVTGDKAVDFSDLTAVLAAWGNDYAPGTGPGDANADGMVDFDDVTAVLGSWLIPCP